ncbi:hypothetical protein [Gloeocapsopsis dulcis]|uniref:HTH domain-containing protein n=1 Tax=Gloeocapsopsis dulcis AAB1 = 1H9 TaxID=1433147 RepID=A0A6N8G2X2_9CHRO|nr:hypothetical protein [Gloeocapsopsis dulcis]MUL39429.1 hypothetical protein [Gloeocapsopsis dulcis AAB1 = 1H9]WNN92349.1 hypothetical protein P0S91_26215 [Gloeocapsopsis dulcis]
MPSPRFNPSLPPRFHEMDEYAFQEMCRDLFAKESGIRTCDIYGARGQSQKGIDLLARCDDITYTEVGQCKCYEDFPPRKIKEASDEFFAHLDYWQQRNVRRFILFVACGLENTQRQDEIDRQIQRFANFRILYEAWEARTLRQKLSPHPDLVYRYLQSHDLVEIICGPQSQTTSISSRGSELTIGILSSKIESLSSDLSKAKARCLEEYRELYHQGKLGEAYDRIVSLRNDDNWEVFEKPLQSKILQALAGYAISVEQDTDKTRSLADQALDLDPEEGKGDNALLQVLISYYSESAEVALKLINNPSTINLFNLKLSLLLQLGRTDEIVSALQDLPQDLAVDAETHRIYALALLKQGDIASAKVKIQKASYEKPDWETIRATKATINYFSTLAPVVPYQLTIYPQPVEWSLIKRDDESSQRLREAANEFQHLASQTERGEQQRNYWKIWHLACLANDIEQQLEARELCSELLVEDPTNYQAIIWRTVRNYEIDLSPSQQALEALLHEGNTDLEHIIALLAIYLYLETPKDALELLKHTREVFAQAEYQETWFFWYVQALVLNGEIENALREAEAFNTPAIRRSIQVSILREQARVNGNWQALAKCLESCWQESGNAQYLLELCQLQASLQDWVYVADRSDDLVNLIGTPDALSLAAQCASQAGRAELSFQLLSKYHQLFPGGVLPPELRQLKAYCQAQLGFISQAVAEAEELVRSHETVDTLTTLMDLQLTQGDLRGAAITASRLLRQENVHPIPLLRAARCLLSEDRNLACELWRRAVALEITPDILGEVITLGFNLRLEPEVEPFVHQARILAITGESPFQAVRIHELLEMQRDSAERAQEISQQYDNSELPIHLILQAQRLSLTNIFHVLPEANASDPNPQFQAAILARYGGRPFPQGFADSSTQWRLHLDISAFLLAAHLGILDAVERRFSPVRISQSLPKALLQEFEYFLHHQPSRLDAHREIIRWHQAGRLQELTGSLLQSSTELVEQLSDQSAILLEQARVTDGFVVEFLPLKRLNADGSMQPVVLDEADQRRIINCRALVEVLEAEGILSKSTYEATLAALGDQAYADVPPQLPDLNASIFLNSELALLLAGSDLLAKVCRYFRVFVTHQCIREAQAAISKGEHSAKVVDWLRALTQRVATGLEQGKYEMIAIPPTESEEDSEFQQSWNSNGLTIYDLFRYTPQTNDVIWVDDRFFSKYPNRDNSVPIIGVLEILEALRVNGDFDEREYYDKILQLRKGNIRYIPITSQEVLYYLKETRLRDGRIRETEELAIIRRYIASCLLDSHRLQRPPLPERSPSPDGEMMFIFESFHATLDSITAVWADISLAEETAIAYSDWILSNLYTGMFGVRHLLPYSDPNNDGLDLISNDISTLYFRGIQLWNVGNKDTDQTPNRRKQYFEWIEQRITESRFRANPELISSVARLIRDIIFYLRRGQEEQVEERQPEERERLRPLIRLMLKDFCRDLPDVIRDELNTEPELISYFQAQMIELINLTVLESSTPLIIPASDFFPAIASAINGREATITAQQPKATFKVHVAQQTDTSVQLQLTNELDSTIYTSQDEVMLLASENPSLREQVLRSHRIWFDCDNSTFERVVNEIVSTLDLRKRIDQTDNWRKESAAAFYLSLQQKLYEEQRFSIDDLIPPSGAGLLRHFHLGRYLAENINFHEKLNHAAESMLKTEELENCIERFSCLPVKLPVSVTEAFRQLLDSEKEALLQKLIAQLASPICKLHLINLALLHPNSTIFAQNLIDEFYSEAGNLQFRLFKAVLSLLSSEFSYWHETREWSTSIRLAMIWAHTSKLHNLLYDPGVMLEDFVQNLEECSQRRPISADILNRDPEFWNSVLHPHRLNRRNLVVYGLAAILRDHDPVTLQAAGIPERVINFAATNVGEQKELLHDLTLAQDNLESLLGGNRSDYLMTLVGKDLGQQVSSKHLKSFVEDAIDTLINEPFSRVKWQLIVAVIGDLPIYNDLVEKLDNLIRSINFVEFYYSQASTALFALMVACNHAANTANEELRTQLEEELVAIARLINNQEQTQPVEDKISDLVLECVLKLAVRANDPRTTSRAFNRLFEQISFNWSHFIGRRANGLSRGLWELPANQLHGTWTTNLLVRTLRDSE